MSDRATRVMIEEEERERVEHVARHERAKRARAGHEALIVIHIEGDQEDADRSVDGAEGCTSMTYFIERQKEAREKEMEMLGKEQQRAEREYKKKARCGVVVEDKEREGSGRWQSRGEGGGGRGGAISEREE